ncbi:neutral zinc metallopeptidase [uncultured Porphyromonas sp.]|uniref:KPN_02809 family neutral zinc metallopeptidase n=1 Tax=uncultured Porphyromonas sp. TaxID=159274 RepID=UPI0025DF39BF|nr:neutral zinc metallopeptidase [uncultured Porphyromonas sp.]
MRLDGRQESSNVEDRRGRRVKGASMGIGGLIVVGLITWLMGGNPLDVLRQGGGAIVTQQAAQEEPYTPTAEEEEMATFAKVILKGTEDAWTEIFAKYGKTYTPPQMVLYTDAVQSGCGGASSQVGPFYCSADQTLYIDLSFFNQMKTQLGAGGDFAYAYVIAHEVGHHVQNLLGTLDKAHARMAQVSKREANAISVRLELQADYYAGMWAHYDDARFGSLEPGDIEEGINAAHAIGDDKLQMEAQGYVVPDAFNHGTSKQRMAWLYKGYREGTLEGGDTFSLPDPSI